MSENQLNSNAFGESIRRGRKQKGMTQEALAQMLSVSAQAVSKWETGQSLPDIGLLLPLSKALGVGVNDLLGGSRRQELEKKFQASVPLGQESSLLVSLEALEEYPDDETFLYRRACDELFLGERDIIDRPGNFYYLDHAIGHFEYLHAKYSEAEHYTTMLVRAYRARGRMDEADKLARSIKTPENQLAVLTGEDKLRQQQREIREQTQKLCTLLLNYNTLESLEAHRVISEAVFGENILYENNGHLQAFAKKAELCRDAGDTEGFVSALTKAYELAKQYDGLKRGITPCKVPLLNLLTNEVRSHWQMYWIFDSLMHLLEDPATLELKGRIVDEQITYHQLRRHEWQAYFAFCKRYACGPTWMVYSTQYDHESDPASVTGSFRFRGYFDVQMHAYYRALVERLISEGVMKGYCAYAGNDILAYINCKEKDAYFSLGIDAGQRAVPTAPEGSRILAIVDMLVAPAFVDSCMGERLLQHALKDAQRRGFTHAEVYLTEGLMYPEQANFEAILTMYLQAGFVVIRDFTADNAHQGRKYHGMRHYILQKEIDDYGFSERATRFTFGDYIIDVDVERTREIYKTLSPVSRRCTCTSCENFDRAVDHLPTQVLSFFESMGVDLHKVTEAYSINRNQDGSVHYGGFCHISGKIVKGRVLTSVQDGQLVSLQEQDAYKPAEHFAVWFGEECAMTEAAFGAPVIQLDFGTNLPWVIDKKFPKELLLNG